MEQIPKSELEFIQKVIELAKEHGCFNFSVNYAPPWGFHHDIKATWSRGRHNEPAKVHVQSQQSEWLDV